MKMASEMHTKAELRRAQNAMGTAVADIERALRFCRTWGKKSANPFLARQDQIPHAARSSAPSVLPRTLISFCVDSWGFNHHFPD
jgi:hypothetical protein